MGLIPGTIVAVERVAPAGDPIWLGSEGQQLSLRRLEAEMLLVEGAGAPA
jgi:Fe2+ transport system protein FeoA